MCKVFTVREMMEGVTRDYYLDNGVFIDEVSCNSILRAKKIKEDHDRVLCLMQLSMGHHGTVFNMQPERAYEVALIDKLY